VTAPTADSAHSTTPADETTPEIEERGRLEIDQTVVREVAEHAANLVPGTATISRTLGHDRGAMAKIGGSGNLVDIALDIGLHYPADVRGVVGVVREKVTEEVSRLTGYRVHAVEVTVSALQPEPPAPRVR
jgi:uncharacterized alkaline shock family protein YloU